MSEIQVELLVQNQKGLHARAAAAFVKSISEYDAEVTVSKNGQEVDGGFDDAWGFQRLHDFG